mmetsp:Transcript_38480/g.57455  ORF Transcript_38480/g.57455 Transcript_38480/m.57455 type:complete len:157 (-) Transcript_38480:43-513(-)
MVRLFLNRCLRYEGEPHALCQHYIQVKAGMFFATSAALRLLGWSIIVRGKSDATVSALMRAAATYQVLSLLNLSAQKAEELVDVNTAVKWLQISTQLAIEQLKDHCAAFVVKRLGHVPAKPDWEHFMQDKQMVFERASLFFRTISSQAKRRRSEAQ